MADETESFSCPLCQFCGRSPELVTGHVNTVHASPSHDGKSKSSLKRVREADDCAKPADEDSSFGECPVCGKSFRDYRLLREHVDGHFSSSSTGEIVQVSSPTHHDAVTRGESSNSLANGHSLATGSNSRSGNDDASDDDPFVDCPHPGCTEKSKRFSLKTCPLCSALQLSARKRLQISTKATPKNRVFQARPF